MRNPGYLIRQLAGLGVFLLAITLAHAAPRFPGGPAQGLWWNPTESGRGFGIELQGDIMVITTYGFDRNGSNTWFVSAGLYDHEAGEFTAAFDNTTSGQCFGCPYVAPQPRPAAGGPIRVYFESPVNAVLYFTGGSTRITRQYFGLAQDNASFLLGRFSFGMIAMGVVASDWPIVLETRSVGDVNYAIGTTTGNGTNVIGRYEPDSGNFLVLVRADNYERLYVVRDEGSRLHGTGWAFRSGTVPQGNGVEAFGHRLLQRGEVNGQISVDGPGYGLPGNQLPNYGQPTVQDAVSAAIITGAAASPDSGARPSDQAKAFVAAAQAMLGPAN